MIAYVLSGVRAIWTGSAPEPDQRAAQAEQVFAVFKVLQRPPSTTRGREAESGLRWKAFPAGARLPALVVMIASTVVFRRVLVEIAAVAPRQLVAMGPPIGAMLGVAVLISIGAWFLGREPGRGECDGRGGPRG